MVSLVKHQVNQRLTTVAISPALHHVLLEMVDQDDPLADHNWAIIIPTIACALGATDKALVQPFALAWGTLNAALRRLDHVQDDDARSVPLPTVPVIGAHYNLLLSYYLLATALLDTLDGDSIPPARLLCLRQWWADCLLRVASGQQADLEVVQDDQQGAELLTQYQHVVQAKTGALFALAFGGTARLLTDDVEVITVLSEVGEVYGMLVQYGDDVRDADEQVNRAVTLPHAYAASRQRSTQLPVNDVHAFWHYIYMSYMQQVEYALAPLPIYTATTIRHLFTRSFESS